MGGMSPQDEAQGRNSPREATPVPGEDGHDEATPEQAGEARRDEATPEQAMQIMHHGDVYVQQPMCIEESPQIASPSALMVRRQRTQARNSRVPMPSLTMDTEDARRVGHEEDALDAPHYKQIKQEVKQRRLRREAEKQRNQLRRELCRPSDQAIYERLLTRTHMWTTTACADDNQPEVDSTYENWLARTQSWLTTACEEDARHEVHEQDEDMEFFDTLERQSNASAE